MNETVNVCLCSIPTREYALSQTVGSVLPQLPEDGHLYVFLNDYDHVPDYLDDPRITVATSQEYGDRGDTNKFFFVSTGWAQGYIVLLDDDIVYPPNHIEKIITKLKQYDNRIVVSFHGEKMKSCSEIQTRSLEGIRDLYQGLRTVPEDTWVHVVGTGSSGYHSDYVHFTMEHCLFAHMTDIFFACYCQQQRIPMLVIAHKSDNFGVVEGTQDPGKCIWVANCLDEDSNRNTYRVQLAILLQLQPWTLYSLSEDGTLHGSVGGPREKWLYTKRLEARPKPVPPVPVSAPSPVSPATVAPSQLSSPLRLPEVTIVEPPKKQRLSFSQVVAQKRAARKAKLES